MQAQKGRGGVNPAIVTLIVAVLAMADIFLCDFGPGSGSQGSGNTKAITAAAVARAGAIEISSEPPADQSASRAS